jgi:hypothetical protein
MTEMKTLSQIFAAALMSCVMTGCVGTLADMQHSNLVATGQPAEYSDGYRDGYQSGQHSAFNPYAAHTKNVDRYLSDPRYQVGWDDGFNAGYGQYRRKK